MLKVIRSLLLKIVNDIDAGNSNISEGEAIEIVESVTATDVYVAINSQYHDYAELFRSWFTDGIEQKVIESAIVFWFKDADSKSENKVVEYFREH